MRSCVFFIVVAVLSSCAGLRRPPAARVDAIIVDMPHGGWRVHVYPDGSGSYGFGALPELGMIEADTFDFEAVYDEVAGRILAKRRSTGEYGTVQFCIDGEGCRELWFFYDQAYADELFDRAYRHRVEGPAGAFGADTEVIDRMWRQRGEE